jgi:hypothetical protein
VLDTYYSTVSGVISGEDATLDLAPPINGVGAMAASVAGDSLTLTYPTDGGGLGTITLTRSTTTAYNAALANLRSLVAQASASASLAASAAASASAEAQRRQALRNAIDQASVDVQSALSALQSGEAQMQADLGQFPKDLATMQADVATTHTDEQHVLTEVQQGVDPNQARSDADGVQSDADGVQSDRDGLDSDKDQIGNDESAVQSAMNDLGAKFATLADLVSQLPSYRPMGLPTATGVGTAESESQSALAKTGQAVTGYLAKGDRLLKEAAGYASAALAATGG